MSTISFPDTQYLSMASFATDKGTDQVPAGLPFAVTQHPTFNESRASFRSILVGYERTVSFAFRTERLLTGNGSDDLQQIPF